MLDAASVLFAVVEDHDVGQHHLRVMEPTTEGWLQQLADEYRRLRTQSLTPARPLSLDGVEILSIEEVQDRLTIATVPQYETGNFGVGRSDLAELLLGLIQERSYGCQYGYRSIRDRELRQRPGRGIDQIGIEVGGPGQPPLTLMLGEAKLSTEARCPPGVVDTGPDCLAKQHQMHLTNRAATADKIWDASRQADDADVQQALRLAAELLRRNSPKLRIVVSSLLVRPKGTRAPDDFGSFHARPTDYTPADIRFIIVRLPGNLESRAQELISLAAGLSPGDVV